MSTLACCKFCGSDKGFRQHGTASVEATRRSRAVTVTEDGTLEATWDTPERDGFLDNFESEGVTCLSCHGEADTLQEIAGQLVSFSPGDVVIYPDGFRGVVETADNEARTLTVQGWHETFKFGQVDRMKVTAHG